MSRAEGEGRFGPVCKRVRRPLPTPPPQLTGEGGCLPTLPTYLCVCGFGLRGWLEEEQEDRETGRDEESWDGVMVGGVVSVCSVAFVFFSSLFRLVPTLLFAFLVFEIASVLLFPSLVQRCGGVGGGGGGERREALWMYCVTLLSLFCVRSACLIVFCFGESGMMSWCCCGFCFFVVLVSLVHQSSSSTRR